MSVGREFNLGKSGFFFQINKHELDLMKTMSSVPHQPTISKFLTRLICTFISHLLLSGLEPNSLAGRRETESEEAVNISNAAFHMEICVGNDQVLPFK